MIHYKDPKTMAKVACKAISPQAESARPLAVDCPHCKATLVFRADAAELAALARSEDALAGTPARSEGAETC